MADWHVGQNVRVKQWGGHEHAPARIKGLTQTTARVAILLPGAPASTRVKIEMLEKEGR